MAPALAYADASYNYRETMSFSHRYVSQENMLHEQSLTLAGFRRRARQGLLLTKRSECKQSDSSMCESCAASCWIRLLSNARCDFRYQYSSPKRDRQFSSSPEPLQVEFGFSVLAVGGIYSDDQCR